LRWCLDYEQQCDEQEIVLTTQGKISDWVLLEHQV
jgi:hypothetical protein